MHFVSARNSKTLLELDHKYTDIWQPEHKPRKLRRFMSLGSRRNKTTGKPDMNIKCQTFNASLGSTPLQTLSPRPTEFRPVAKETKRSISTFLLSRYSFANEPEPAKGEDGVNNVQGHLPVTETPFLTVPPAATNGDEDRLKGHGHLPVTGNPHQSLQMQPRKDSATKLFSNMRIAASRTAALTSHPVRKEDLESEEEFQTPVEFQKPEEFWGRQKVNYLEK